MQNYIIFSTLLFAIGIAGLFINRKNIIILLMCLEIILLAVNTNFIIFAKAWGDIAGQAIVFFVMTVAAAESAIGLALVVLIFRDKHSISVDQLNQLNG
ncbi:MAG TPA: NADH-quinone oxidoreductase subunit NuoK [Gammaproteobacteria bacterium]|nr:NADH-quinone oxidoreductase subunit NuoK [Gammaproteobacteria bacterium]